MRKKEETNIVERDRVKKKSHKLLDTNDKIKKIRKILLLMLVFLIVIYFVLKIAYETGRFTVVLDSSSDMKGALVMYANKDNKITRRNLQADVLDFMTNISGDWIPENIDDEVVGRRT